jgi:hypothetical protein
MRSVLQPGEKCKPEAYATYGPGGADEGGSFIGIGGGSVGGVSGASSGSRSQGSFSGGVRLGSAGRLMAFRHAISLPLR